MSTKVYGLVKLPGMQNCSAQRLANMCKELNSSTKELIRKLANKNYMITYTGLADNFIIDSTQSKPEGHYEYMKKHAKELYNFSYVVYVYDNNVFIHPFGSGTVTEEFNKIIDAKYGGRQEFGYWDNSDHPEEYTKEEWKAHGEYVDDIIGSNIFSEGGFNLTPQEDIYFPGPNFADEDIPNYIPSFSERVTNKAENFAIAELLEPHKDLGTTEWFSLYRELEKSQEYKDLVEKLEKKFEDILPKSYTSEELLEILRKMK